MDTEFKEGDRVELIHSDDPYSKLVPGTRGTVKRIATHNFGSGDERHITVAWTDGSMLTIIPEEGDVIRKVKND